MANIHVRNGRQKWDNARARVTVIIVFDFVSYWLVMKNQINFGLL